MENGPGIDYSLVLADLKRRRDDIDRTMSLIESMVKAGVLSTAASDAPNGSSGTVLEALGTGKTYEGGASSFAQLGQKRGEADIVIPSDAFFGMSISQAAQKFLSLRKKPATAPEMAEAFEQGGLPHQSAKLANTINSVLGRNSVGAAPIFAKVRRGVWGLRAWYPNYRPKDDKDED